MHRSEASRAILLCCRRLWQAGLIAGQDGNVSVRYRPDRVLVTPRGLPKSDLAPDDLVEVGLDGTPLGGSRLASTELDLHLRVYRRRRDCGAVVHAHPPAATGFAVAGEGIPANVLPEVAVLMGEVPVVPTTAHSPGAPIWPAPASGWRAWNTRPGSSWPPEASAG
jgi:L-fuculose-phosphate aldolase